MFVAKIDETTIKPYQTKSILTQGGRQKQSEQTNKFAQKQPPGSAWGSLMKAAGVCVWSNLIFVFVFYFAEGLSNCRSSPYGPNKHFLVFALSHRRYLHRYCPHKSHLAREDPRHLGFNFLQLVHALFASARKTSVTFPIGSHFPSIIACAVIFFRTR